MLALVLPQLLHAQYVGASIAGVSSTVDWQYPAPPVDCGFCISDASPNSNRNAIAPAIAAQWRSTHWLGVASELRFISKGYAITQPTLNVDYLEIPLLLRLGRLIHDAMPIMPFAEVGPALAINVHCVWRYSDTFGSCRKGAVLGEQSAIRRTDISGVIGAGLALRIRRVVIVAGGRVDWGLRDIGGDVVPTKNRSTLMHVGMLVPISSLTH